MLKNRRKAGFFELTTKAQNGSASHASANTGTEPLRSGQTRLLIETSADKRKNPAQGRVFELVAEGQSAIMVFFKGSLNPMKSLILLLYIGLISIFVF
tara:strand:+ start:343 stop:636 length:294 start_codon:yes stop_codon:yes gene_type:complete